MDQPVDLIPVADLGYQAQHADQNATVPLAVVNISVFAVTTVFVLLKLLSRRISKLKLELDDYTLILAWVFYLGLTAICLPRQLGGKHIIVVGEEGLVKFLKALFGWMILYSLIVSTIKISLVLFYRRLFHVNCRFRTLAEFYIGALVIFGICGICTTVFACRPINAYWDKTITTAQCLSYLKVYLAWTVVGLCTDLMTLIMPLPLLWRLQLPLKQKMSLSIIFVLGGMTCISTAVKLWVIPKIDIFDVTYSYNHADYWAHAEIGLCFTCACLPTMGPLIHTIGRISNSVKIKVSRISSSQSSQPTSEKLSWQDGSISSWPKHYRTMSEESHTWLPTGLDEGDAMEPGGTSQIKTLMESNPLNQSTRPSLSRKSILSRPSIRTKRPSQVQTPRQIKRVGSRPEIELSLHDFDASMDVDWIQKISHD